MYTFFSSLKISTKPIVRARVTLYSVRAAHSKVLRNNMVSQCMCHRGQYPKACFVGVRMRIDPILGFIASFSATVACGNTSI